MVSNRVLFCFVGREEHRNEAHPRTQDEHLQSGSTCSARGGVMELLSMFNLETYQALGIIYISRVTGWDPTMNVPILFAIWIYGYMNEEVNYRHGWFELSQTVAAAAQSFRLPLITTLPLFIVPCCRWNQWEAAKINMIGTERKWRAWFQDPFQSPRCTFVKWIFDWLSINVDNLEFPKEHSSP